MAEHGGAHPEGCGSGRCALASDLVAIARAAAPRTSLYGLIAALAFGAAWLPSAKASAQTTSTPQSQQQNLPATTPGLTPPPAAGSAPPPGSATSAPVPETRDQLQKQYDALFQEVLNHPTNADLTFKFAEVAAALGNFEAAISALERLLLFSPDLPRVKLELGALYYRLGSYDVARVYLTEAKSAPNVPPAAMARIDALLAEIDRRRAANKFAGGVMLGMRYQSNATAGPEGAGNVLVGGAGGAVLSSQFVKHGDWNFFATGNAQNIYDLETQNNAVIETDAVAYYAKQFEFSRVDLGVIEVSTGPRFDVREGDNLLFTTRPYVLANDVLLGDRQFFATVGAGLEVSKALSEKVQAVAAYEFRFKRFSNSSIDETATQFDSSVNQGSLDLSYQFLPNDVVSGGVSYDYEDARSAFNSNRLLLFRAAYAHTVAMPYSVPSGPLVITPALYRIYTNYSHPDPAVDPNNAEITREWRYGVTAQLGIYKGFSLSAQFLRQVVWADLPNFKYNDTQAILGVLWSF